MYNYNKGTKYLEKGNIEKALQFLKKAEGDFKEKYLNMGNCYRSLGQYKKAYECYTKANDKTVPFADGHFVSAYPLALNNLGLMAYGDGKDDLSEQHYRDALAIDPVYYDALWNLGQTILRKYFSSTGTDWELGWKLYEYRFKRNNATPIDNVLEPWDRVSCGDKIVVLTEQGLGDKIMFGRYLSHLKKFFNRVIVQCHPSLDCFYSDYEIIRDPVEEVGAVSVPICSLAGIFGLVNEKWLEGKFNARKFSGDFNIGCVWNGSSTHLNNANRSCPTEHFSALSDLGNLYSLNPGARVPKGITDISSKDWSETAANVLGLDLVVSVDTSIVHLCGTLGVPCIMVQPLRETDFRWGRGHADTPWYESVVIVENNNNWSEVFRKVRTLIEAGKNV